MINPGGATAAGVTRDLCMALVAVLAIPFAILLVGAPLALFVRLLLEAARLVLR